ncbi:hypothetical protein [Terriglobus albidus]|uniref:hypothetical protein n=1 Tax=Terriglobus albidus TaxID=1592106 RepID=UPI0021DF88F0|nr:hypothetical protein [Terriglobus albidus]
MRYEIQLELEDQDRMLSRVLQALEHAQAVLEYLTFSRHTKHLQCRLIAEVDGQRGARMESLLWKIHGVVRMNMYASLSLSREGGHISHEIGGSQTENA